VAGESASQRGCECVCVCVCVCVCASVGLFCLHVCVCEWVCAHRDPLRAGGGGRERGGGSPSGRLRGCWTPPRRRQHDAA